MCKSVIEYAWRVTQQLVIYDAGQTDYSKIKGWGSGFFLRYRDHLFLITADHCLHGDDYEEGRIGKDDLVFVNNNIIDRGKWTSVLTPIGGFYYFDRFHLGESSPESIELVDVAFSICNTPFVRPFYTIEVSCGEEIICHSGKEKYCIDESSITNFEDGLFYVCAGTIYNSMRSEMLTVFGNAIHTDLLFINYNKDGEAILNYQRGVKVDEWKGLSGCPIIDENYHLAGFLIRVSEEINCVTAIPIKNILHLLDFALVDIST